MLISFCTPTSIILEWICISVYARYIDLVALSVARLLVSRASKDTLKRFGYKYLQCCYLNKESLTEWKNEVLTYTTAIADVFKKQNNHHHQCVPVDTGSIIEHFGVPLSSNRYQGPLSNSLRTDHDVMFIVNDLVASEDLGTCLQMIEVDNSLEYYHILPRHGSCSFINDLQEFDSESNHGPWQESC